MDSHEPDYFFGWEQGIDRGCFDEFLKCFSLLFGISQEQQSTSCIVLHMPRVDRLFCRLY